MSQLMIENLRLVKGLDPVADAFAGTVASDVVNMQGHESVMFVIYKGVGTTGTSTITVEACDDVTPTNTSAIPFHYRAITTGDTEGAVTAAAAAGFATGAGSSEIYAIEAQADELSSNGYGYVRLAAVEVVNSPVLGGVIIVMGKPRHTPTATAIV